MHGCAFSPIVSSFTKSIDKDKFITWPGIDDIHFYTSLGTPMATEKGQLDQERKNLRSIISIDTSSLDTDIHPTKIPIKTHHYYTTIMPAPEKGM